LHDPLEDPAPKIALCVRIGGVSVCHDCVREYAWDFDEAVVEWHAALTVSRSEPS
jgi:hypothetical protein